MKNILIKASIMLAVTYWLAFATYFVNSESIPFVALTGILFLLDNAYIALVVKANEDRI